MITSSRGFRVYLRPRIRDTHSEFAIDAKRGCKLEVGVIGSHSNSRNPFGIDSPLEVKPRCLRGS